MSDRGSELTSVAAGHARTAVSMLKALSRVVTTFTERYVSVDRAVAGNVGVLCERPQTLGQSFLRSCWLLADC